MKVDNLSNYKRGWIVGSFFPNLYNRNDCEVGIKYYKFGDSEPAHTHKLSDECSVIALGTVEINGELHEEGSIVIQHKGDVADFKCISERAIVVVFRPDGSFPNDKEKI